MCCQSVGIVHTQHAADGSQHTAPYVSQSGLCMGHFLRPLRLFFFFFFLFCFPFSASGLERAFRVKPKRHEAACRLKAQGTGLPLSPALKGMLPCTAGCAEDCLMILDQCPIPSGGTLCSGVGWCLSTQGICQCYLGYAGDDCSSCDEGYVRYGSALLPCTHLEAVPLGACSVSRDS